MYHRPTSRQLHGTKTTPIPHMAEKSDTGARRCLDPGQSDEWSLSWPLPSHSLTTPSECRRPYYPRPVSRDAYRGNSPETFVEGSVPRHDTSVPITDDMCTKAGVYWQPASNKPGVSIPPSTLATESSCVAVSFAFQPHAPSCSEPYNVPSFETSTFGEESHTTASTPICTSSPAHTLGPSPSTTKTLLIHHLPRVERLGNILWRLENDNPELKIVGAYWLVPDSDQPEGALVIHVSHSVVVGTLRMYENCYVTVAFPWTLPTEDNTNAALGMDETQTPALPGQTVPDTWLTEDGLDYDASYNFQGPPLAPPTDTPSEHLEVGWNADTNDDQVKDLFRIGTEDPAQVVGMTNVPSRPCTDVDAEFETPMIDNSIKTQSVPYDLELGPEAQLLAHTLFDTACSGSTSHDYPEESSAYTDGAGFDPCAPTAVDPMFMPTPPPTQSPNSVALSPGPSLFPTTHCICLTLASSFLCMPDGNAMALATSKFPFTEATIFSFTRAVELGGHRQLKYQKINDAVKHLDREFAEQTRQAIQDAYASLFLGMPAASDGNAVATLATAQLKLVLTEAVVSSFIHSAERGDYGEIKCRTIEDVVKDLDMVFADQTRRVMWLADAEAEEEIL